MHMENEWENYEKVKFYLLKQYNYTSILHLVKIVLLIFMQKEWK